MIAFEELTAALERYRQRRASGASTAPSQPAHGRQSVRAGHPESSISNAVVDSDIEWTGASDPQG